MANDQMIENGLMVLIVGAGPTGLTLACELARRGVSFRLIEAVSSPQPGSRGKGIQPRTLDVFDDLGIVDRVIAHGRLAMPMRTTAPDGKVTLAGTELSKPSPDIPYPATLLTPEWRVEEALRLRLTALGSSVEFGAAIASFDQSEDAVSAVIIKDGVSETVVSRWLVGCDGGHSTVRKQAGIAFDGETRDEVRMIVADVEVDGLDRDAWHIWSHEDGMISLCPLPSTHAFQCQSGVGPGQDSELSLANIRIVDRYREGSVFLAGDAAHVHSPAGFQGMNTGIQDAQNLGWKIAAVARGASPALLNSYEAERRPVAVGVLALSNEQLKQAIEQKGIPTRRDARTMQLSINYRGSSLARDDRDATAILRAGDRAPDATGLIAVEGERRLFDLTRGGRFTLLNFGPMNLVETFPSYLRTFHVVGKPGGSDDIADSQGHLASAYGAVDRTLVLIRPDGYVALISDAGEFSTVSDYLAATG